MSSHSLETLRRCSTSCEFVVSVNFSPHFFHNSTPETSLVAKLSEEEGVTSEGHVIIDCDGSQLTVDEPVYGVNMTVVDSLGIPDGLESYGVFSECRDGSLEVAVSKFSLANTVGIGDVVRAKEGFAFVDIGKSLPGVSAVVISGCLQIVCSVVAPTEGFAELSREGVVSPWSSISQLFSLVS